MNQIRLAKGELCEICGRNEALVYCDGYDRSNNPPQMQFRNACYSCYYFRIRNQKDTPASRENREEPAGGFCWCLMFFQKFFSPATGTGLFCWKKESGRFLQCYKIILKDWLSPLLFHSNMCISLCPAAGRYIFLGKLAGSCEFFID